jgi:hypothetical protein
MPALVQLRLSESLGLARASLDGLHVLALDVAGDPLRLDLPPLGGAGAGATPDALRAMAALYLQAELEQAGIIPVAEMLAQSRTEQSMGSPHIAVKLEAYAERMHRWYDRPHRDQLFARLFGIGGGATNEGGNTVNREFQQAFATLCHAIVRYSDDYRYSRWPSLAQESQVRQSALSVAMNLGARQFGNTLVAGRLIQEQLQASIELLRDPDLGVLFQSQGLWATLRKILGPDTPDLDRLVSRGQSGLHLLNWLATVVAKLGDASDATPLLPPDSPAFGWAATWLQATDIQVGSAPARAT